ncbi:MAG: Kae1-associated serine/threonine protein kinase [Thermoplasmata archaeon]|nr:Kae1-associated serine/threonine protein kinase [Thermoplasmata archaeon]
MSAPEPPVDGAEEPKPTHRGAEAAIAKVEWLGWPALRKSRDRKVYRPKELDERLRRERTRNEARLLSDARRLGVRTPIVYDVDLTEYRLVLEELPGATLKEMLDAGREDAASLEGPVRAFGEVLGRLHAGGISHGDLTSSNVMFPGGADAAPALIDLSLGHRSASVEELGIDLHLVEEDLGSLHPNGAKLYKVFLDGYQAANPDHGKDVRQRAKEIKGRMRYV